jgi:hypothetical protein
MHDDMSAKPCENCNMIMVNYDDLWIVHTQVTSQLKGTKLKLKELNARSLLLGACTSCLMLNLTWKFVLLRVKNLSTKLIIHLTIVFSLLHVKCVALSRVSFSILPKRTITHWCYYSGYCSIYSTSAVFLPWFLQQTLIYEDSN